MARAFLGGAEVWKTILSASRAARGRRYVATPYLTEGMGKALGLQKGDVLICALNPGNAKRGATDPREAAKLQQRGVRLYSSDNLHAKIYLLGRKAIVGSANLTRNSRDELDEAATLLRDPADVRAVKAWFEARLHSVVQSEWLQACLAAYRPPQSPGSPRRGRPVRRQRQSHVLLASLVPREDSEQEERWLEADERIARKRLEHPRQSVTENFRWHGNREFARGDEIIQILKDGRDIWVHPHGRVVLVRRRKGPSGGTRQYVHVEMPKSYRRLRFSDFAAKCRRLGLRVTGGKTKAIIDPVVIHQLLLLTSPEKLRRR